MSTSAADSLNGLYHRTWWALLLRGLLALAVGIFILIRPLDSVAALALVIALWALFTGFVDIVHGFELKRVMRHWWVLLVGGLIGVGFGIAALVYYPTLSLAFVLVLVVWWLMLTGVFGTYAAFRQRMLGLPWGWTAAFGVVSIVAAVVALVSPPATLAALMGLLAAFAIIVGIALVVGAFKLHALVQH